MLMKRLFRGLLVLLGCAAVVLPAQAGMVGTAQMHDPALTVDLSGLGEQRAWIEEQLIVGGVDAADARQRVAALTDAQVTELQQRIDAEPAGGNALLWVVVILLVSELAGWTDIIPAIRPVD